MNIYKGHPINIDLQANSCRPAVPVRLNFGTEPASPWGTSDGTLALLLF
jgi:hypothetical protein